MEALFAGFHVLTAVTMKGTVFWDIAPYSLLEVHRRCGVTYFLYLQGQSETNTLSTRKKINTINTEQTPFLQISTQTHMDVWNSAIGGQPPIPT
jgi:hypothetical protein